MTGSSTGGNNARTRDARDLSKRTGMKHTAALALVTPPEQPRQPRDRWLLTDDVRAFFAGAGWHGLYYPDLYDWVDTLKTSYECDWCADDGDARTEDSSIELIVAAYDPDLSPQTMQLATKKYHARCKASRVSWVSRVDIPPGPHTIGLPASERPDMVGEFEITARPHLDGDMPLLLLTATVTEDHGEPVEAWLNELALHLEAAGFGPPDSIPLIEEPPAWTVRVVTGHPSTLVPEWLAVRTEPAALGETPGHFYLGGLSLPETWATTARRAGRILVCVGPRGDALRDMPAPDEEISDDDLDDLMHGGTFIVRWLPVTDDSIPAGPTIAKAGR